MGGLKKDDWVSAYEREVLTLLPLAAFSLFPHHRIQWPKWERSAWSFCSVYWAPPWLPPLPEEVEKWVLSADFKRPLLPLTPYRTMVPPQNQSTSHSGCEGREHLQLHPTSFANAVLFLCRITPVRPSTRTSPVSGSSQSLSVVTFWRRLLRYFVEFCYCLFYFWWLYCGYDCRTNTMETLLSVSAQGSVSAVLGSLPASAPKCQVSLRKFLCLPFLESTDFSHLCKENKVHVFDVCSWVWGSFPSLFLVIL